MALSSVSEIQSQDKARVLKSRPTLSDSIEVVVQRYRGENWFVLYDPLTSNQMLLEEHAYRLVSLLDGRRTLEEALVEAEGVPVTEDLDSIVRLLDSLQQQDMLAGELRAPSSATTPQPWYLRLLRVFSIRVPLLDPDKLLTQLLVIPALFLSSLGRLFVGFILLLGLAVSIVEWGAILFHWQTRFMDPTNLIWLIALYPLVKVCHEMAHGLVAKYYGAEVHEMGILFLVFFPVPYVDASTTSIFSETRPRMLVAAAGIVAEMLLAAVAIVAWAYLPSGLIANLCFNVAVLGGVSTLLFNGNPLLRFDGYYVLADAIESPNLGTRANTYLGYLFRRFVLGLDVPAPRTLPGEVRWLVIYGISSAIYRLVIGITIAVYVAGRFFLAGLVLAFWYLTFQVLRPMLSFSLSSLRLAWLQHRLFRPATFFASVTVLLPLIVFLVPVPHATKAWGVVLPDESALIRAEVDGFAMGDLPVDGSAVRTGDVLLSLRNDELEFSILEKRAHLAELEARLRKTLLVSPLEASTFADEIQLATARLNSLVADFEALQPQAPSMGMFSALVTADTKGRWIERGTLLGVVSGSRNGSVRAMVSQTAVHELKEGVVSVSVMSLANPGTRLVAELVSETPLAVMKLPEMTLGSAAGGPIAVDASDPEGLQLLEPMFEVSVLLPAQNYFVGQTVLVRFQHDSSPIGSRLVRWLRNQLSFAL